ncbi:hypothetical protein D3C75_1163560 [compost metagenome]
MTDLPKCPTCGRTVEYLARETRWAGRAEIRCVGHHSIGTSYHLGQKQQTREQLIKQWNELEKDEVKNG